MSEINVESFTKAFIHALSNESILQKLNDCIGQSLKFDIQEIKTSQDKLFNEMSALNEKCTQLQKENNLLKDMIVKRDQKILELNNDLEHTM